jgi:hypothetical protein
MTFRRRSNCSRRLQIECPEQAPVHYMPAAGASQHETVQAGTVQAWNGLETVWKQLTPKVP